MFDPTPRSDRPTVIVVDDEPDFLAILQTRLGAEGWRVLQAGDVAGLYDLLEENEPDVLILDHSLPGITGVAAAKVLLRNDFAAPIVIFSAYLSPDLTQVCREIGLHPVDKISYEELVATCYTLLETEPVPHL
ncbi:MAG TPA: response regulator transcription factor [Gaiellaceae bacterium]|nr:response regulator transcription factor [Gaiellaceae bacterium]